MTEGTDKRSSPALIQALHQPPRRADLSVPRRGVCRESRDNSMKGAVEDGAGSSQRRNTDGLLDATMARIVRRDNGLRGLFGDY
jgi:hypothetical protein